MRLISLVSLLLSLAALAGCDRSSSSAYFVLNVVPARENQKELDALAEQLETATGDEAKRVEASFKETSDGFEQRQKFVANLLEGMFGTPDAPIVVPETKLDENRIRLAAGPTAATETGNTGGLYRRHCVHCHGVTGDGAGPTAEFLNPYPRDFRHGNFKFKATAIGEKPTDADLHRIIADGINDTAMPSFKLLPKAEIDALVEYVKYLSIRGQVETALHAKYAELEMGTTKAAADKGLEKVESLRTWLAENKGQVGESAKPLVVAADKGVVDLVQLLTGELKPETYQAIAALKPLVEAAKEGAEPVATLRADVLETVLGGEVMMKWNRAEESIVPVLPRPEVSLAESIRKGRDLFYGRAACVKCHGDSAQGDGQFFIHNDPKFADQLKPLVNPLLPPQVLTPRDLRYAVVRGGRRDADIYRRLYNGIDNVGMPGLHGTPGITDEEIWHVVAYVQSLPYEAEFLARPAAENTRAN